MSQENVELVRSIYAAWERGDFSSAEWAHPEIEYVQVEGPEPGVWTGLAGMAEGTRDFLSTWKEFRIEADEYRELDGERVLVLQRHSGRGKTSGVEWSGGRADVGEGSQRVPRPRRKGDKAHRLLRPRTRPGRPRPLGTRRSPDS